MIKKSIPQHLQDYFMDLKLKEGIELTDGQKKWYYHQWSILGDKIKQEYPSTPQEAFMASTDAYFFANEIATARNERRIIPLDHNPEYLVYVSFDIGVFDHTVLWFYQWYDNRVWIIDYYEDNNKSYDFYLKFALQEKPYHYGTFILPHDSAKRDDVRVKSYADKVREILDPKNIKVQVLKKSEIIAGINVAKVLLNTCYFDSVKCAKGLDHLSKYKRKWHEQAGWIHEPQKTIHNHAADSFRYLALSIEVIKRSERANIEDHENTLKKASRMI